MTVTYPSQAVERPAPSEMAEFQDLFFKHYTRVYAVLFRLTGSRDEAEDLALETFWKLWQQPPSHSTNVAGWLYRVATRLGYNALRAAKHRAYYETLAASDARGNRAPDPAEEAERSDERARVRAVLSRMPERDAQLLILRYSGLAYKEIAAAIGISANSVGTLLTRAEQEFERMYTFQSGTSEGGPDASRR